jgi:hypothetical protein
MGGFDHTHVPPFLVTIFFIIGDKALLLPGQDKRLHVFRINGSVAKEMSIMPEPFTKHPLIMFSKEVKTTGVAKAYILYGDDKVYMFKQDSHHQILAE